MAISFSGISFEKTINTRISTPKEKGTRTPSARKFAPLQITVTEHKDKKTEITTLKSMFKISSEYAEKLNINKLVGDIVEGKSQIVMHPETETHKGKVFCFSDKAKGGDKSKVFKVDVLLNTLKSEGLVHTEFGTVKGEKIQLGLKEISSEFEGLPEGWFAWQVVASETTQEEVTEEVEEVQDTTVASDSTSEVEDEELESDLY